MEYTEYSFITHILTMKKTLYPKTWRIWNSWDVLVTEKLDGSNLWIFMLWWELIVAQRNNVFKLSELNKSNAYKGLIWRLEENKDSIDLCEWSWVFWEWIAMGKISYWDTLWSKFHIFAKANINEDYEIKNLNYNRSYFIYPFESQKIPDCMSVVKVIKELDRVNIDILNELYDEYCSNIETECEWFVVVYNDRYIEKYVRHKNWKKTDHKLPK